MVTDTVRRRALDAIHHLADDSPPWQDVLEGMCSVIGGESATFILVDLHGDLLAVHQWNIPSQAQSEYVENYFPHDIVTPKTLNAKVGTWFDTAELFSAEELSRSAYYADFMCRYDMRQMLTWMAERSPTRHGGLTIQRSHPGSHARRGLDGAPTKLLTDEIQLALHARRDRTTAWLATAESAFARSDEALVLLNPSGRVQYLSPCAERSLASSTGLAVRHGRLSHPVSKVEEAIAAGLRRAASGTECIHLSIPSQNGAGGLLLELVRAQPALALAGEPLVLARLQNGSEGALDFDRLIAAFDVTPAEARVARCTVCRPNAAAARSSARAVRPHRAQTGRHADGQDGLHAPGRPGPQGVEARKLSPRRRTA